MTKKRGYVMPYYIYGRPVRPADHLEKSQQGVDQKATPSSSPQEKILEYEDNMPTVEGEEHNE